MLAYISIYIWRAQNKSNNESKKDVRYKSENTIIFMRKFFNRLIFDSKNKIMANL